MSKPKASEVTQELIQEWKKKHRKVVKYTSTDGKVGYFHNPDLTTVDAATALAKTNPIKSNKLIAEACFLGGDEELVTNDEYIFGMGSKFSALIEKVEGELTEL